MTKKLLLLVLLSVWMLGTAVAGELAIVANKSVKASEISADDLRDVFNGRKANLSDGTRVTPVTLKQGAAHAAFLRDLAGKNDAAFRATWRSLVFSGQAAMPKAFDSEAALLDYVAATPGTIGYVSKGTQNDGVKHLAVK